MRFVCYGMFCLRHSEKTIFLSFFLCYLNKSHEYKLFDGRKFLIWRFLHGS